MSDLKETFLGGQIYSVYCPKCNHCDGRFGGNDYRYGSPLRTCPKCKTQFINSYYHEIEIEGISPIALNAKRTLIGLAVGILFFVIAAGIHLYEITYKDYYHTMPIYMMIICAIVIVYAIIDFILIKTGFKNKRTEKKREESIQRLKNTQYALQLKALGYNVPEKYLPLEGKNDNETLN